MVNFLDNSDQRQGFKASLRDFWDRDISRRPQKAIDMFLEGTDVCISLPSGYGKSLIYQAAPVKDRLSFLEETGHYIYCIAR